MVARADSGAMTRGWWPLRTRFSATRTTQFATPLTSGGNDSVIIAILMPSRSPVRCSKLATTPLRLNELSMTINAETPKYGREALRVAHVAVGAHPAGRLSGVDHPA